MDKGMRALAHALLPYSYVKRDDDGKKMTLCAGNGAEVTFEKLSSNPVVVSLSAEEGNEWAVRQVAHILQGHPAFTFIHDAHGDTPWKIQFKSSAVENMQLVRGALLNEVEADAALRIDDETLSRALERTERLVVALKRVLQTETSDEMEARVRFALDIARHIVQDLQPSFPVDSEAADVRIDPDVIRQAIKLSRDLKTQLKRARQSPGQASIRMLVVNSALDAAHRIIGLLSPSEGFTESAAAN